MSACAAARENLTAWLDGELSERQARSIDQHVEACAGCAAVLHQLRTAVAVQRLALPRVAVTEAIDTERLWRRLHAAVLDEPDGQHSLWTWLWRPFALASLAATAMLVGFLIVAGGPRAVLLPLGVVAPPPDVAQRPDLFKDYRLIEQLDALENFDTVETVPLEDDSSSENG
jgi:anti-sigma factor RsiW